ANSSAQVENALQIAAQLRAEADRRERDGEPMPAVPDVRSPAPQGLSSTGLASSLWSSQHVERITGVSSNDTEAEAHIPETRIGSTVDIHPKDKEMPTVEVASKATRAHLSRYRDLWLPIASGLLIAAAGICLLWARQLSVSLPLAVTTPVIFAPIGEASSLSGPGPQLAANRSITLSVPPLPQSAFKTSEHGSLVAIEFGEDSPPQVVPQSDEVCPTVVPDKPTIFAGQTFIRPTQGQKKWVLVIVTDRPAVTFLKTTLIGGTMQHDFASPQSSMQALVATLRAADYDILASGQYILDPITP